MPTQVNCLRSAYDFDCLKILLHPCRFLEDNSTTSYDPVKASACESHSDLMLCQLLFDIPVKDL